MPLRANLGEIVTELLYTKTLSMEEQAMEIVNDKIDAGKAFDWGKTSADYAKYRDIYPEIFYEKIARRGLCVKGQKVLDLGTGTGVLPRNMHRYGAKWIGSDISENQIRYAEALSKESGLDIEYRVAAAEELSFPENRFDVITACQCFWYFDYKKLTPKLARMLKPWGKLLLLYMAWLPFEDKIAGASEQLVLKYSPNWSGAGEKMHPITVSDELYRSFEALCHEEYALELPFTRETWHGRMKACRGIGASLSPEEIEQWEIEHRKLLAEIAPERFSIRHYAAMLELGLK